MYEGLSIPDASLNLTFLVPDSTVSIKEIVGYSNGMITTITEYQDCVEEEYTDLYEILEELELSIKMIKDLKEVRLCQDQRMYDKWRKRSGCMISGEKEAVMVSRKFKRIDWYNKDGVFYYHLYLFLEEKHSNIFRCMV